MREKEIFTINAEVYREQGRGAGRRLCAANKLPAVIYSDKEAPLAVELDHDKIMNMQVKIKFYSEVLITVVDSKEIKVKAQDVQCHLYKPELLCIDLVRA